MLDLSSGTNAGRPHIPLRLPFEDEIASDLAWNSVLEPVWGMDDIMEREGEGSRTGMDGAEVADTTPAPEDSKPYVALAMLLFHSGIMIASWRVSMNVMCSHEVHSQPSTDSSNPGLRRGTFVLFFLSTMCGMY